MAELLLIVGSSAGALIGLQFVVLSLIASQPNTKLDPQTGGTFSTPTIIHFSTVLTLAAIFTTPWAAIRTPRFIYCVAGVAGIAYSSIVTRRMNRQKIYQPEFEDWLFHSVLPIAAYGMLLASAIAAQSYDRDAVTYRLFMKPKP